MKEFRKWHGINSISLCNKKPIELLNTSTRVDLVYDELLRIANGYVVYGIEVFRITKAKFADQLYAPGMKGRWNQSKEEVIHSILQVFSLFRKFSP
jgi:hypothetical protein